MPSRHAIISRLATAGILTAWAAGCGVNVFSTVEKKDPPEDATLALEAGDPDKAINILLAALADSPDDPQLVSILATAFAQRAGVEPLVIVQNMAAQSSEGDSTGTDAALTQAATDDGLLALFDVMPEATTDSVADIQCAVALLTNTLEDTAAEDGNAADCPTTAEIATIDASARLAGDTFKLAIFQTASLVMSLKILDTNGDGALSPAEILGLADGEGGGIVTALSSAIATLAQQSDDEMAQKAATLLSAHLAEIEAAEGETSEDKLKDYLINYTSSTGTDSGTGTGTGT